MSREREQRSQDRKLRLVGGTDVEDKPWISPRPAPPPRPERDPNAPPRCAHGAMVLLASGPGYWWCPRPADSGDFCGFTSAVPEYGPFPQPEGPPPQCEHGDRRWKSKKSEGGRFNAWFCALPRGRGQKQCHIIWTDADGLPVGTGR